VSPAGLHKPASDRHNRRGFLLSLLSAAFVTHVRQQRQAAAAVVLKYKGCLASCVNHVVCVLQGYHLLGAALAAML
jgi:hypothetical protein